MRCINCAFSVAKNNPKGAYRLICTNNGRSRRYGDTCPAYWDKQEMKEFIDRTIHVVREK